MKAFYNMAALLAAVVCLAGCGKEKIDYTRIVFDESKLTIEEGGSASFTIIGLRNNSEKVDYDLASNPLGLEFTVSDANVLEIAGPGMLKGKKQGYAILSCVSPGNPAFNCRCKVTVLNNGMYHLDTPFDASMAFHCHAKAGFCATQDYLEAEGILIKDDCMYLGALSWNSGASCYNATFKLK